MLDSPLPLPVIEPFGPAEPLFDPLHENTPGIALQAYEQAFRYLNDRGFIQFHPLLAARLGHKAALFLGLALYWTRHTSQHQPHRKGWFYMTAKQWNAATGLSSREQSTARSVLIEHGLLRESLEGRPAALHYRADVVEVARWVDAPSFAAAPGWEAVSQWFRNCVSFYRPLADLTGSVACGLYLSYLLQQQRKALLGQQLNNGCIRVSQDDVCIALCLGPKVQRNARERLKLAGLIREAGASLVMLNLPAIMACLRAQDGRPLPRPRKPASAPLRPLSLVPPVKAVPVLAAPPAAGATTSVTHEVAPMLLRADGQLPLGLLTVGRLAPLVGYSTPEIEAGDKFMLRMRLANLRSVLGANVPPKRLDDERARNPQVGASMPPTSSHNQTLPSRSVFLAENAKLGSSKVAENAKLESVEVAENAKLKLPKTHISIQMGITNTTTTTHARAVVDNSEHEIAACRRRPSINPQDGRVNDASAAKENQDEQAATSLVYPRSLDAAYLNGVRSVVAQAPAIHRQALLDELEGQLCIQGKTIHNPPGWLMGLIRQYRDGDVVLAMAEAVSAERTRRLRIQHQVERSLQGVAVPPTEPEVTAAADPAVVEAARQKLKELRAGLAGKRGQQ